mmetsp:Transcript_54931/g.156200  ORF Transcript_54931/g.156200 Transcript_54931/m.156200 type:complete len:159 (+) Transcript_54931:993-1469(+)
MHHGGIAMSGDEPRWAVLASWALAGFLAPGALCSDMLLVALERALGVAPPWSQRAALAGGITIYATILFAALQLWAGSSSSSSSTGLLSTSTTPILQIHITISPTLQSTISSACQAATALLFSLLLTLALILRRLLCASTFELGTTIITVSIIAITRD